MKHLMITLAVLLFSIPSSAANEEDKKAINEVLNQFHTAASKADWDTYLALTADDLVFIGTDASERWSKEDLKTYGAASNGWTYTPKERHVDITPDGNTAWFDELLDQVKYGTSRGTGVLIRTNDGWKIQQYHLTFPIPNGIADHITQQIMTFEAREATNKH